MIDRYLGSFITNIIKHYFQFMKFSQLVSSLQQLADYFVELSQVCANLEFHSFLTLILRSTHRTAWPYILDTSHLVLPSAA